METFVFSVNAVLPIAVSVFIGVILRKTGLITPEMISVLDRFVFKIALPLLMFCNIYEMDLHNEFKIGFVLFCVISSLLSFLLVWALALRLFKDRHIAGAFAQASVRGSISLLAMSVVMNIYGTAGVAAVMIASAVPVYNIMSVLILTFCGYDGKVDSAALKSAALAIAKNPLILGILAGLPFAIWQIRLPESIFSSIENLGACTTPVGLMSMGATFCLADAVARFKPAVLASAIKLLVLPLIGLPVAVFLGFRDAELLTIVLMLGSASTPTCYVMAKQMNCDGPLSANVIVLTQLMFIFTLPLWLFILRSNGLM